MTTPTHMTSCASCCAATMTADPAMATNRQRVTTVAGENRDEVKVARRRAPVKEQMKT